MARKWWTLTAVVAGMFMLLLHVTIVNAALPQTQRALGAVAGIAVATGPVIGGVTTSGLSWRWIFLVNVPVGIATIAVTLAKVAESRGPDAGRPDWRGFASFSTALAALVYGLISAGGGWGSVKVIASLSAAAGLLAAFVIIELAQRRPMLDLTLFRVPTFTRGLVAAVRVPASLLS